MKTFERFMTAFSEYRRRTVLRNIEIENHQAERDREMQAAIEKALKGDSIGKYMLLLVSATLVISVLAFSYIRLYTEMVDHFGFAGIQRIFVDRIEANQ